MLMKKILFEAFIEWNSLYININIIDIEINVDNIQ